MAPDRSVSLRQALLRQPSGKIVDFAGEARCRKGRSPDNPLQICSASLIRCLTCVMGAVLATTRSGSETESRPELCGEVGGECSRGGAHAMSLRPNLRTRDRKPDRSPGGAVCCMPSIFGQRGPMARVLPVNRASESSIKRAGPPVTVAPRLLPRFSPTSRSLQPGCSATRGRRWHLTVYRQCLHPRRTCQTTSCCCHRQCQARYSLRWSMSWGSCRRTRS